MPPRWKTGYAQFMIPAKLLFCNVKSPNAGAPGRWPDRPWKRVWRRVTAVVKRSFGGWRKLRLVGWDRETKTMKLLPVDDLQMDLKHSWEKCRGPGFQKALDDALNKTAKWPAGALANDYGSKGYRKLVAFCCHLALALRTHVIPLSGRTVGDALGHDKNTIGGWLGLATTAGLLELVKSHYHDEKNPKASRPRQYRVTNALYAVMRKSIGKDDKEGMKWLEPGGWWRGVRKGKPSGVGVVRTIFRTRE